MSIVPIVVPYFVIMKPKKYREQIEMYLMIHVLRVFDLIQLKKNRLIK